jgi:hypothetical protein
MSHDYCPGHAPMDQPAGDSTDRRAIECPLCQILVIDDINEQRQAAYTALCEAAALPIIEYYSALTPQLLLMGRQVLLRPGQLVQPQQSPQVHPR